MFNLDLQHEVTRLNPEQLIFNYSNRKLSDDEIELLSHSLRYALPPTKIEYSRWFLPFEKLLLKLKDIPIYDSTQDGFNFVRRSLKNTALKYFYSFKPHLTELHKNYYKLINDLRKDKTILILNPVKGNAVVLLNKIDYQQKMMTIIIPFRIFNFLGKKLFYLIYFIIFFYLIFLVVSWIRNNSSCTKILLKRR